MKIIIVSGGFDPLHSGHIEHFRAAKELGDILIVGLNSDEWLTRKKGKPFMDEKDRIKIIEAIEWVDEVFLSIDMDKTVCKSLEAIKPNIFTNGGDRTIEEIPESIVCKKYGIEILDGLGKKIRSSSDLTGLKSI